MQDFKLIERSNRPYIYICYVNDKPVYVGKGTNKRYKHCTSGKSTNPYLNKAFFEYGIDNMYVDIVEYDLDPRDAYEVENYWIKTLIAAGHELFNFMTPTLVEGTERLKMMCPYGLPVHMLEVPEWVNEQH